jgi:hypothetical protein
MTYTWDTVPYTWNEIVFMWNEEIFDIYGGGSSPTDYWGDERKKHKPKLLSEEQYIKIFITVHNQFLTESQKNMLKITKAYPTYEEKHQINKDVKMVLENFKQNNQNTPLPKLTKVKIDNIKLGLNKIVDHVKNNPTK